MKKLLLALATVALVNSASAELHAITIPARFSATIKTNSGTIAAGTLATVALALGAYYGIPAYKAHRAMQAFEATAWGKFATAVARCPYAPVPKNPRALIGLA